MKDHLQLISPEHLKKIDRAMNLVVNDWDGSGREAKLEDIEIRGKTGSAEFGTKGNFRIYAWFIAYAKIHGKTIAAAFIVEEGVSGGRTCAPLAADFFAAISQER